MVAPLVAALALAIVGFAGQGDAARASVTSLRVSTGLTIPGEPVEVTGTLTARGERPVELQELRHGQWQQRATASSKRSGAFTLVVRPTEPSTYRVFAPRSKVSGRSFAAATSSTVSVKTAAQRGSARSMPAIAAYGTKPQSSTSAKVVISSRFTPVRAGRPVALQKLVQGRWTTVQTRKQNSYGSAAFALSSLPAASLRVVALRSKGAAAVTAPVLKQTWKSILQTEFSGSVLPAPWRYRLLNQYPGGLRGCARSTVDMVSVGGGVLSLSAARDARPTKGKKACPNGTYRNGHVGTADAGFLFTYGVAAARVKFQRKQGQHGAFWVQSTSQRTGAEMDAGEFFGAGRPDYGFTQFVHYPSAKGSPKTAGSISNKAFQKRTREALASRSDDWWKAYHVFSVEWTPSGYVFRIDGVETFRTNAGRSSNRGAPILSMLTSDWEAASGDGSKQSMRIDWVRVWQR